MDHQRYFVGIDIGGTNTKMALLNDLGEIDHLNRILNKQNNLSPKTFLSDLGERALTLMLGCRREIDGIGISTPGLQMEDGTGTLFSINMPAINKVDLKSHFETTTQCKTVVTNDLVAHSLAEGKFGSGKNVGRFLSVSMGTGIGHTYLENGKPALITHGISGDSGRMILDPNSAHQDSSGICGSVEALCGVKAIETLAQERYTDGQQRSAHTVISAARQGTDSTAREIMALISRRLAVYLINLSALYFPEVISLAGGQTEAGDFFVVECQKEFERLSGGYFERCYAMMGRAERIKIKKSEAGGLAALLGSIVPLL